MGNHFQTLKPYRAGICRSPPLLSLFCFPRTAQLSPLGPAPWLDTPASRGLCHCAAAPRAPPLDAHRRPLPSMPVHALHLGRLHLHPSTTPWTNPTNGVVILLESPMKEPKKFSLSRVLHGFFRESQQKLSLNFNWR
jgi:hypothetical protein